MGAELGLRTERMILPTTFGGDGLPALAGEPDGMVIHGREASPVAARELVWGVGG
jgi:hypothetical protein